MQLENKSSTIKPTAEVGSGSNTTDTLASTTMSPDVAELYRSIVPLNREVAELKEKVKLLEAKQNAPDTDLTSMISSVSRLSTLTFILLIILPICVVAIVMVVMWLTNPESIFVKIAAGFAGAIGIGALVDVIVLPIKFSEFKKELETIKKSVETN